MSFRNHIISKAQEEALKPKPAKKAPAKKVAKKQAKVVSPKPEEKKEE
tara:strand:- start:1315 stop:1458 length:144 start_codon:yes stop_codon:yes gene_type:complete